MADLIDRSALKDYISNLWDMQDAYLPCHFFDAMDDMPTIDAEPVRHAHWIDAFVADMPVQVCSLCNVFFPLAYTGGGHHYCPSCGAKMDEEV